MLAAGLAERGWDVRVIARSATTRRVRRVKRADGVTLVEIPGFGHRRLGAAFYLASAVPLGLWWGSAATAFLAIQVVSPAVAAGVCSALWRRPYLAFTSTTGELSEVSAVLEARTAPLRRRLLRRARYLVSQTPEAAQELAALTSPERIAVLPTPVRRVVPPPLDGQARVLFTGRLAWEKNLVTLLDAWRTVLRSVPSARLTLVGEGGVYRAVEDELRRIVSADPALAGSVAFTGWVENTGPYLASHDVFVLPSLTEGMSNALLEGCAWGRVVVASAIPGNRAVLGDDYPLLFPPTDADRLAAVLGQALVDKDTRATAVEWVRSRMTAFDLTTIGEGLERLIIAAAEPALGGSPAG